MLPYRLLRKISLILISMLFTICFSFSVTATASPTEKHILFLAPSTPDYPAFQLYTQGVKNALAKNLGYEFGYSYEYLDFARYPNDEDYLRNTAQYFKLKYQNKQPDFIVTIADLYPLLSKYGKDIFPNVPFIVDWNEDNQPLVTMPSNYIVMPRKIEIEENVKLILKTIPSTKTIYVVVGDSASERNIANRVREIQNKYADQCSHSSSGRSRSNANHSDRSNKRNS